MRGAVGRNAKKIVKCSKVCHGKFLTKRSDDPLNEGSSGGGQHDVINIEENKDKI